LPDKETVVTAAAGAATTRQAAMAASWNTNLAELIIPLPLNILIAAPTGANRRYRFCAAP